MEAIGSATIDLNDDTYTFTSEYNQNATESILEPSVVIDDIDNSEGLHKHLVTENKHLLGVCNKVMKECYTAKELSTAAKRGKARTVIRTLVINSIKVFEKNPTKWQTVSLNKNDWDKGGRYYKLRLKAEQLSKAVQRLAENGYVELVLGNQHWNPKERKQTRIRATAKLIEAVDLINLAKDKDRWKSAKDSPRIELRAAKERPGAIAQPITVARLPSHIAECERFLEKYQALLDTTIISLPAEITGKKGDIFKGEFTPYDKYVRRVFNNGAWDKGGRLYGGFWQGFSKEARLTILLDGQEVTEIDIRATFPVLVYHSLGIDYWGDLSSEEWIEEVDPYYIDGYTGEDYRKALKKISSSLINATNEGKNQGWLTWLIRKENISKRVNEEAPALIKKFIAKHPQIPFFDGEVGMKMMFLESEIALAVIKEFTRLGKPVLTVHDSFIAKKEDNHLLNETIVNAYYKVTGFTPFLT
ncbi:MAG: hypothetical protein P4L77_06480 [Sulfuriferula sp.]|nr:hypothetical protein [Sulfuriferula sp.]